MVFNSQDITCVRVTSLLFLKELGGEVSVSRMLAGSLIVEDHAVSIGPNIVVERFATVVFSTLEHEMNYWCAHQERCNGGLPVYPYRAEWSWCFLS